MDMCDTDAIAEFRRDFDGQCTDPCLVEQAKRGGRLAFETLVRRYRDQFFRVARGYFANEADAQNVVQDAFLKIHRNLESFRGDARFKNWAYRIVVNTALSRLRRHKRRGEVALENVGPAVEDDDEPAITRASWRRRTDEVARNRELRGRLAAAVAEMDTKYESIFLLYEVDGLSLAEISQETDLSVAGVKSRLHRARLFLRATLEPYVRQAGWAIQL